MDSGSPASTVVTSGNFEPLNLEFDIVFAVLDDLDAALSHVVFRPGVFVQLISLGAVVTDFCLEQIVYHIDSRLMVAQQTV